MDNKPSPLAEAVSEAQAAPSAQIAPPPQAYVPAPADPAYTSPPPTQGYVAPAPATYSAPATAPPADDIGDWINRFKAALDKPETVTAFQGHQPWYHRFVAFFDPIDTCVITCCCPCVTFGKTHHRLRKDANMRDYSPVNQTCIGFCLGSYLCLSIPLMMLQRNDIRQKFDLQGDCVTDFARAFCCPWCDLVQQDKEAEYQALGHSLTVTSQPSAMTAEMKVPFHDGPAQP